MVLEKYRQVEERVAAACKRAGRNRNEVLLMAASKTKPVEMMQELMTIGVKDFGESKVQELKAKLEIIQGNSNWHFIGRLQRNKVKYLVGGPICLIHSVDSVKLAREIQKEAVKKNVIMPVLLEINIGGEANKGGVPPTDAESLLRSVAEFDHIKVRGLMTVAPKGDEEDNRGYFRQMRELRDQLAALKLPGVEMVELSMGMTHDFETAIEEGATIVRIGSAIFGGRSYYDSPEKGENAR